MSGSDTPATTKPAERPLPLTPASVGAAATTLPAPPTQGEQFITPRSVAMGLFAVCVVCGLQPYNDYVATNAPLIGSFLPLATVLVLVATALFVQLPLRAFAPRYALTTGEVTTALAMLLASCSVPAMLRVLLPTLVAPFYHGVNEPAFWRAFTAMELPGWLFPVGDAAQGRQSDVVVDFYGRRADGEPVPLRAWLAPLACWGVFLAGLYVALVSLAALARRQWADAERLPFPLARVQELMSEAPARGRWLNGLFGARSFWVAALAVLAFESIAALHRYHPRHVPQLALGYDLRGILTGEPWVNLSPFVGRATVYFTFIGVTYFIQANVAFSLWALYLIQQLLVMRARSAGYDIPDAARVDQHVGATFAFAAAIVWLGRAHWAGVLRRMVTRPRPGEADGDFCSDRVAAWLVVAGAATMVGCLRLVGVQWWVGVGIAACLLAGHVVVSRIVCHTGLPFIRTYTTFARILTFLPLSMSGPRDVYFAGVFNTGGAYPTRESAMALSMHAMQVAHENGARGRRTRRNLLLLMGASILIGFAVCSASSLYCYYSYATPVAQGSSEPFINWIGAEVWPLADVVGPLKDHAGGNAPSRAYSPWTHTGIGAAVVAVLQVGASRWAAWPFSPVGFLVSMTWYMDQAWFSIMIGWLAKVLIVRFGGASFYQRAMPAFVGLIVGESLAAGGWLVVNLLVAWSGHAPQITRFLPT